MTRIANKSRKGFIRRALLPIGGGNAHAEIAP